MRSVNLLTSSARVQAPYITVQIGNYTFGVKNQSLSKRTDTNGFYSSVYTKYPNYIQTLDITKINGQVNQYTLQLTYPIEAGADPNFFEKVFSSVSTTRKIVFSYGDASMPNYIYKNEEAIITKIAKAFKIGTATIQYTVYATSTATLGLSGCHCFSEYKCKKPSEVIRDILRNNQYDILSLFTGMAGVANDDSAWRYFINGTDKAVNIHAKSNVSILDYLNYLVSCMIPEGSTQNNLSKDIYILTIHDESMYDEVYSDRLVVSGKEIQGPYFKVSRTSYAQDQADAYTIDIGFQTSTIVTDLSIEDNECYALYYDYQMKNDKSVYVNRIGNDGKMEQVFSPAITSKNENFLTKPVDITWWSKITQYPIKGSITIQGLLRPAVLMSYVRLNIFYFGNKHIDSGLYLITSQKDNISTSGYRTTLGLTRISGDDAKAGNGTGTN